MGIALACPSCGARMEYQAADAGRGGQCPTCKADIQVPLELKTCVSCGRQVAVELASCPACGAPLSAVVGASAAIAPMMPALGPTGEVRTSGKAVTSLVFGLFSLVTMCVTGVPAIILGALALGDINRSAGRLKGRSMATAGVVFGVIGSMLLLCVPVLIVLLLPAVQMAREAARRTHCRNNLAQIGLALHEYHDVWSSFPPPYIVDAAGRPLLSWRVLILPYLGHQTLYDDFHLNEPWDSPHNMTLASLIPTVFVCPSDDAGMPFTTAYVAISGPGTAFPYDHSVKMVDVTDGLAGTGMIGELKGSTIIWSKPDDLKLNAQFTGPGDFSSRHPGGWNMLFVDGSVRFLSDSISPADCRARMTIAGGETDEY